MKHTDLEIVNTQLMHNADIKDFINLGFIECYDGVPLEGKQPPHVWGISYEMDNDNFNLSIDCCFVVTLTRKSPDTEGIKIHVLNLPDLEDVINWIK
jgi:hypothetical protein